MKIPKMTRNNIIIIVCILLVVLLIYLNRKNLKELFYNNFSEYDDKHKYNDNILHKNKYRYELPEVGNVIKTFDNKLVVFARQKKYDKTYQAFEKEIVVVNHFDNLLFIHNSDVGYIDCIYDNANLTTTEKGFLLGTAIPKDQIFTRFSLFYDQNERDNSNNSFKNLLADGPNTYVNGDTELKYFPDKEKQNFIKCNISKYISKEVFFETNDIPYKYEVDQITNKAYIVIKQSDITATIDSIAPPENFNILKKISTDYQVTDDYTAPENIYYLERKEHMTLLFLLK